MVYKPHQQNQTQNGTDVFADVIQAPIRVRTEVVASPNFVSAMEAGGVTANAAAETIGNYYSTNVQHFVDRARQQTAIGGLDQTARDLQLPGLDLRYRNNQGAETLYMTFSPEQAPPQATSNLFQTDFLYDGYVWINQTVVKPTGVFYPGYWYFDGEIYYFVDQISGFGTDTGIGWAPGNPYNEAGLAVITYNPATGALQQLPRAQQVEVACYPAAYGFSGPPDNPSPTNPPPAWWVQGNGSPFAQFPGGYGISLGAPPDGHVTFTVSVNGNQIAEFTMPYTSTPSYATYLFKFGKDAVDEHSENDALQPFNFKFLNKILPPRSDNKLIQYEYLKFMHDFPTLVGPLQTVEIPDGMPDNFGKNTLSMTQSFVQSFNGSPAIFGAQLIAEFYDRKEKRLVVQSPHYPASADLILTNDKPLIWVGDLNATPAVGDFIIDFGNPPGPVGPTGP